MFYLKKLIAVSVFLLLPFTLKAKHHHHQECSHHAAFKIEDLEGSYIVQGFTAGSPQLDSSTDIFLMTFRDDGTGVVRSLTLRTFTGTPPATTFRLTTPPNARPPEVGTIVAKLNPDGTAELLFFGIPTPDDITTLEAVFKKSTDNAHHHNNKITSGFALRTAVNGPSANSAFANEIKPFNIERQLD